MCAFVVAIEPPGARQPRLLTLTFPGEEVPADHKKRLNRFLYEVEGAYIWRADISTKLRLHYHVLYWGPEPNEELAAKWEKAVGAASPRAFRATGPASHKRKYFLRKRFFQKAQPLGEAQEEMMKNIGRFWGHSQDLKPRPRQELTVSQAEAKFIRRLLRKWGRLPEEVEAGSTWVFCNGPEDAQALFNAITQAVEAIRSGRHCWPDPPPPIIEEADKPIEGRNVA